MRCITKFIIASYNSIRDMNIRYLVLLVMATVIASCKNNDNVFPKKESSFINVVNASGDTLNVYLNGSRQNNTSSLFPGGQSLYITVPAGAQNYSFKKAGNPNVLFNIPLNLKDSTLNSVYITNETASGSFTSIEEHLADTAHSAVRFVNASPDAGNLDVAVGDSLNFFSGAGFKSVSAIQQIGFGQKRIRIYFSGAAIPRIDTTITMQPNLGYTIFSRGSINSKSNPFKVGIAIF